MRVKPDWPGLMKQATAAAYCDMSVQVFERAVATGALPMPVLINGAERWSRNAIDRQVSGDVDDWRSRQPLYQT